MNANIENREQFEREVKEVCETYQAAAENEKLGIPTISNDEKTGIQALERESPTKPMRPGSVEKREYNYERHGTTCLFGNLNVATGEIVVPMLHATRKEEDFVRNIENVITTDPEAGWNFVLDHLNTHQSESLVILVAKHCGITSDLGVKGKSGVLKSLKSCLAGVPASQSVFDGQEPQNTIRFYAEALFMAEPNRMLVQRHDTTHPDSRKLPLR